MNRAMLFSTYTQDQSYTLERAEIFMGNTPDLLDAGINSLLNFYSIKQEFDNDHFLNRWSYWQKAYYVALVDIAFIVTEKFFLKLNSETIGDVVQQIEEKNIANFWKLFNFFNLENKINRFVLARLMHSFPEHMRFIVEINQSN
jgi:hypothetical protein